MTLATDESWARTIEEVLSSGQKHVAYLKRISVSFSRPEDHLN
ncbi:MAG TPA: hypothetical protein VM425_07700 [Myxococcota bacterium]|nr:hypothetical protein [Myxococcota bacterium]